MFRATILPSLGILPQKFQKTCMGYWQHLVLNFTPIGEDFAEKTVTKQKMKK